MDRVPSTNKPKPGYQTEIDTLIATKRATEIAEERAKRDAKNAAIDAEIAAKAGEKSDVPAWATAMQTGDRNAGKKQAKLISSKRTPNGGFFQA